MVFYIRRGTELLKVVRFFSFRNAVGIAIFLKSHFHELHGKGACLCVKADVQDKCSPFGRACGYQEPMRPD